HALTVNPHVYISCIKQFWNTAMVKCSGDVIRLQALVDKKTIVITEEVVHEILQLNDAEGVICLPNEEIFAGLARMGYEKPSTKLTFYKAFFSTQWKRVGKGFSRVETPLFETMLAVKDVDEEAEAHVPAQARVKKLEKVNKVKFSKLRRLKKAGTSQHVESSDDVENVFNQGRMIVDMDQDEGIKLVLSMQEDDTEVQEAVEVVTTTKLMTEVVTAAATQVAAASTHIPASKPKTLTITATPAVSTRRRKGVAIRDPEEDLLADTPAKTPKIKDKGKGILIEAPKPMKKKDQIEMDAEYARKLQEEINKEHEEAYKNIDWNATLDHV
nr:hypothetical protein [Tanacetum cinerariifolium]